MERTLCEDLENSHSRFAFVNYQDKEQMYKEVQSGKLDLQNIPEGAAVSLPLTQSGRTRGQSFAAGAASGLVEPLGAVLAFVLAEWVGAALPWLMSAAAGCMVCVTAQEMIPEAVEPDEVAGVISIVLGFALMMALDVAL